MTLEKIIPFFCLFDLILYVPSTIFQLNRDGSSWVEPVLRKDKCVLLKDHNAVTPVRLEPAAPRPRVKHSTTEPLRSLNHSKWRCVLLRLKKYHEIWVKKLKGIFGLYNATFTLCPRRPRQSRFRPPWTKRGDRNTT